MDYKELMDHIAHILYFGNEHNIRLSLTQLRNIMEKNHVTAEQMLILDRALGATRELAEFAVLKYGEEITDKSIERFLCRIYERRRGGRY